MVKGLNISEINTAETAWKLFEATGEIGYFQLYNDLVRKS